MIPAGKASKKYSLLVIGLAAAIVIAGFLLPEKLVIPVQGATRGDWNARSFWFRPWGRSGVHRGIDIFADKGRPVLSAVPGIVVHTGVSPDGGNVISILGPKWRIHYYAHLDSISVKSGAFVAGGTTIGTVGATGNAAGKPPHLHYALITQIPYFWLFRNEKFGADRMFYLDPHEKLVQTKEP